MKKAIFTLLFAFCFTAGFTQVVNEGLITVESGATLIIEGDYTSDNSGSIEIDGTVELRGDLINTSGGIASGSTGTLKFNGGSAQEITGATGLNFYCAVEVNNANGVALTSTSTGAHQVLSSALTLTAGSITLNQFNLTMSSSGVTGASSTKYIVTNGAGQLKSVVAASDVTFPVGNASYNPVTLNNAGTSDTYGVVSTSTMPTNWTTSNHAVGRTWVVTEAVGSGSNLTVTPQWATGDEQASFARTDCAVGLTADDGTSFTWKPSGAATGSNPWTRSGSGFTGVGKYVVGDYFHEGIELDLDLFLAGPYSGGSMSTTLNSLIPTTDPYGLSTTVGSVPATAVDWIKLELRDQTTPSTITKSYAVFVDNNGNILHTDGNVGAKLTGINKDSYYVAVKHRNHLGAMTGSVIDFTGAGPFSFNYTNPASSFYGTNAVQNISGTAVLWAGDANGDGQVIYQGANNDPTPISNEVLSDPGNTGSSFTYVVSGYSSNDINLDGQVIYQGASNDPTPISNAILGHPGNAGSSFTYTITEQLP